MHRFIIKLYKLNRDFSYSTRLLLSFSNNNFGIYLWIEIDLGFVYRIVIIKTFFFVNESSRDLKMTREWKKNFVGINQSKEHLISYQIKVFQFSIQIIHRNWMSTHNLLNFMLWFASHWKQNASFAPSHCCIFVCLFVYWHKFAVTFVDRFTLKQSMCNERNKIGITTTTTRCVELRKKSMLCERRWERRRKRVNWIQIKKTTTMERDREGDGEKQNAWILTRAHTIDLFIRLYCKYTQWIAYTISELECFNANAKKKHCNNH